MTVSVYRNLNRKGVVWSVRSDRTGLVISRRKQVILKDVDFKVSLAGRRRAKLAGKRNVHATVKGTLSRESYMSFIEDFLVPVSYDFRGRPYFFSKLDGSRVTKADYVILTNKGAFAVNPRYK